jgi:hypothetical protein
VCVCVCVLVLVCERLVKGMGLGAVDGPDRPCGCQWVRYHGCECLCVCRCVYVCLRHLWWAGQDLVTPLCSQLTYEGLIDEVYGIQNSMCACLCLWLWLCLCLYPPPYLYQ